MVAGREPSVAVRATSQRAVQDAPDPRRNVHVDERPWGRFEQYVINSPVTVKIITVDPGCRLSLQWHRNRGEMWRVLDAPLVVTVGERTWSADPEELIWIPEGQIHRVANDGPAPARLLEIAFGDFDEDDITRIEDDYGRPPTVARQRAD